VVADAGAALPGADLQLRGAGAHRGRGACRAQDQPAEHDFLCEAELLSATEGQGCIRLLRVDYEAGTMLLERLDPGEQLLTLKDDKAETTAVASVMRELQRPHSGSFAFPKASDWINAVLEPDAIPAIKARHPWIERALNRLVELASEPSDELLLHGDLHHYNVLSGRGGRWVAIDPHGVIGERAWECAPFLFNHLVQHPRTDWGRIVRRRADQLAEELELPRERVYAWSAVRSIQSAWWSLRDDSTFLGMAFEGSMAVAQALTEGG
jgi:streptomycin 6-kinase